MPIFALGCHSTYTISACNSIPFPWNLPDMLGVFMKFTGIYQNNQHFDNISTTLQVEVFNTTASKMTNFDWYMEDIWQYTYNEHFSSGVPLWSIGIHTKQKDQNKKNQTLFGKHDVQYFILSQNFSTVHILNYNKTAQEVIILRTF